MPTEPDHKPMTGIETSDADEHGLVTAGQRRINIIWEVTQAFIAVVVTLVGMYTAANLALRYGTEVNDKTMATTAFLLISNTVFLVIGFYFGRTNHQRTGGIGASDNQTR